MLTGPLPSMARRTIQAQPHGHPPRTIGSQIEADATWQLPAASALDKRAFDP